MSDPTPAAIDPQTASALFANMVVQQTNMALIFLGAAPNPETGEVVQDLETAKILIDQLEMLAIKTRGNLDERESVLMKQCLTTVRMAFVEAVERGPKISPPSAAKGSAPVAAPTPATPSAAPEPPAQAATDDESRKKFSKKY